MEMNLRQLSEQRSLNNKAWVLIYSTHMESQVWLLMPVTYSTREEDRLIVSDHVLNSLTKKANFQFSERALFQDFKAIYKNNAQYTRTMKY